MLDFKESLTMPSGIEVVPIIVICQTKIENPDILDKLYTLCIGNKSMRIVRQNKSIIATSNKLEEIDADLWRSHEPPLQSRSTYIAILMCKHMQKT